MARRTLFFLILGLCAVTLVLSDDAGDDDDDDEELELDVIDADVDPKTKKPRGLFIKAMRGGGGITISRRKEGRDGEKMDRKAIYIMVEQMQEMDQDRPDMKKEGEMEEKFEKKKFHRTPMDKNAEFEGISAFHFSQYVFVKRLRSKLVIDFYVFRENGTITNGDESYDVEKGQMKFTVSMMPCEDCRNTSRLEMSSQRPPMTSPEPDSSSMPPRPRHWLKVLQLKVKIGQRGDKKAKMGQRQPGHGQGGMRRPRRYELGEGGGIDVSEVCKIDGEWMNVSMIDAKEHMSGFEFTFRFPAFNETLYFDPAIQAAEDAELDGSTDSASWMAISLPLFMLTSLYSMT